MEFNLADLFECVADAVPDREALIYGDRRYTFAQLDERYNRLAHHFLASGIRPGDHIGLYLYSCPEYVEAALAAYKIRAAPVNINFRYVEEELRYLFDDADLAALVYHREFAPASMLSCRRSPRSARWSPSMTGARPTFAPPIRSTRPHSLAPPPRTTWVEVTASVAADAVLQPGTHLQGTTTVASGAVVGPDTTLVDCEVDAGASVVRSHCLGAAIGPDASVGPFSLLPAAGHPALPRGQGRGLRRDGRTPRWARDSQGAAPVLRRRRHDRPWLFEHRCGDGVRELRRRRQAPHHGR